MYPRDPRATLFWIGRQYADLGFFADAAEALGELCSRFNDAAAKRLLAEVVWWRENAPHIPWLPPAGDGSRYDRMMDSIDPSALKTNEYIHRVQNENQRERITPYHPSIDKQLARLFDRSIPDKKAVPTSTPVDWSFLDADDGEPGELPDWAKRQIKRLERYRDEEGTNEMIDEMIRIHRWTRNISTPSTPKKYDPNELLFDSGEIFGETDEFDDDLENKD
jgi:hypothetical protein